MTKKKTHQDFVKEVFELVREEYEVIEEYINTSEKILMKHTTCNHEYPVSPNKFLGGRRCPECSRKKGSQKQSKTHEQFVKEVYDLVGDEYKVLSRYVKSKEKVEFRHKACGTVFKMQPSNFLFGQRCNSCCYKVSAEKQKHTTERFISDVFNLVGDEYTVLGEYLNNHTHILMQHNKCGFEYLVQPSNFKGGKRCPKCQRGVQRTPKMYREEVYDLVGDEYTILGNFKNISEGVLTRYNECGFEWTPTPSNFLRGAKRCPKCCGNMLKTHEQFVEEVYELTGEEYSVLGEYTGCKEAVLVRHNECGSEYYKSPVNIFRRKCKVCSDISQKKTNEQFVAEVFELVGDGYVVLEEYNGIYEKINMKHNVCGHVWKASPHKFVNGGRRCPRCNSSKGEVSIAKYLEANNYKYKHQDKFDDCRNERPLSFDYKVFSLNGSLQCLIEFDGIQHFKPLEVFGGKEGFEYRKLCDQIKNDYCIKNNIPLLRIKYTALGMIGEILERFMKNPSSMNDTLLADYITDNNCYYVLLASDTIP
ncbi:zinc-ribbon domain-containing protein [Bacillus pseudomycoides]|uniref:zinc-ribbon domain-containing protein n=1 Tax=Bacillus pseudomycoides TaxID=64104 RepID=UPI0002FC9CB6|nr:zinc-ribbon domain-containing protein [Bacillus pseudomycoides]